MPSTLCLFALTLGSQTAWSLGIVRTERISMAVSSNAEIASLESSQLQYTSALEQKVESMLQEVEDMAHSGTTPDSEHIRTIKTIVSETLLPDLTIRRDSAAEQVKINLLAIDTCNKNTKTRLDEVKETAEAAVESDRSDHAKCRNFESEKNTNATTECDKLDNFLDGIKSPQNVLPDGKPRDMMVEYVTSMNKYFCPKGATCEQLDDACKAAHGSIGKHRDSCNALQAQFELGFCTWRTELSDACATLSTCYNDALGLYTEHVNKTEKLVEKWKVELKALKKILCYVDVWLSDGNTNTASGDKFDQCNKNTPDSSAMNIDFGTPAAQDTCSLDEVEQYPGTPEFTTKEYYKWDFVVPSLACVPMGKTTTLAPGQTTSAKPTTKPPPISINIEDVPDNWIVKYGDEDAKYCDSGIKGNNHSFVGSLSTTLEQCAGECAKEPECNFFTYYSAHDGCTHEACKIGDHYSRCGLSATCDKPISSAFPPTIVFGKAEKAKCYAELFKHAHFKGWKATYPEGSFDGEAFLSKGAEDNHASAIKVVGQNCKAELYEKKGFTGWKAVYPTGVYDFEAFKDLGAQNDQTSGIIVKHLR